MTAATANAYANPHHPPGYAHAHMRPAAHPVTPTRTHVPGAFLHGEQMGLIFQQLPAGVVILDHKGTVVDYNPAALDLLAEPLAGESWWQVIQRAFDHVGETNNDLTLHDGRIVTCQTCPLGGWPGQMIVVHEVTHLRALEGRIKRYQHASVSTELAGRLAHQIRTPLAAALLYSGELAKDTLSPNNRYTFTEKIKSRLKHIERCISDMLLLSGKGSNVDFTEVNTQDLMNEIAKTWVGTTPLVICQCTCALTLRVHVDALVSAINNCVDNAIKAKASTINIDCCAVVEGQRVQICIHDDGVGMPESIRQHVLEPFFTTHKQGTGLGLAVVQSIVKAHGGWVKIDSSAQCGTTLTLSLPVGSH